MSFQIPIRRAGAKPLSPTTTFICSQCRHATLLRRPKRPYTFTQLIVLSDGSSFTHRTTSPQSVYRSDRDTRSAPMWNPSSQRLQSAEEDEAGRLAAFRSKYGRAWDTTAVKDKGEDGAEALAAEDTQGGEIAHEQDEEEDNLLDLISSYGVDDKEEEEK